MTTQGSLRGAELLVRGETDLPRCFVHHPDAGGQCGRPAVMEVYGLAFCEIHGAEARAGALAEFAQDAADYFERIDNPHTPAANMAAVGLLERSRSEMEATAREAESVQSAALRRAYPVIEERVCAETLAFCRDPKGEDYPDAELSADRMLVHKLMRLAYDDCASWLVEALEEEREHISAQLAFALAPTDGLLSS